MPGFAHFLTNQKPLFQHSVATLLYLKFVYDIVSQTCSFESCFANSDPMYLPFTVLDKGEPYRSFFPLTTTTMPMLRLKSSRRRRRRRLIWSSTGFLLRTRFCCSNIDPEKMLLLTTLTVCFDNKIRLNVKLADLGLMFPISVTSCWNKSSPILQQQTLKHPKLLFIKRDIF